ncbi:2-keto-3-deoxy-L-rhamnonate aldolase RhmA [Rhodoligotrophos appendicifer]|uniref:HpcH/HpaI aldolase family protein n=1 Tax=Rhodoligotrophos appendicifer TaxID=987056 RepID=UPI00195F4C9D|nr:aldolase/citrate lyase family protein [Rhodoligotrophos appendicifer]
MSAPSGRPSAADFRQRLLAHELVVGTFIKTPATHPIEIIGGLGFDFVVIDEEHAPFDRVTIDAGLLAARASNTAGIVRVSEPTAAKLLAVLDDGATGVMVPHVFSAEKARDVASACRYRGGKRGFSNTTRAGGFGAVGMWDHVDAGDKAATVVAMIEDPEAIEAIDAIVAVDGIDAFFVGRGDLSVAMGAASMAAPEIMAATEKVVAAAKRVNKPVLLMVANAAEAESAKALGITGFIVSSDQGFLRQAAGRLLQDFSSLRAN